MQQAGYELTDDVNGYRQEGFARFDRNIRRGRRLSAAGAYLHPVMKPPEPRRAHHARSPRRIVFDGTRAIGVEYTTGAGGRRSSVERAMGGEIICCGGAFNSPQVLQLSGVGNASELAALDIPVVHDLPGVGENMQDHLEVYIQHRCTQPVSMAPMLAKWRRPWIGMQWLARRGPGATNHFEGGRLRAQQRRARLPQRDVPLPADRDPLRRLDAAGRARARLPGARRADVLQLARLGEDPLARSER